MAFKMKGFNPGKGTGMGSSFKKHGDLKYRDPAEFSGPGGYLKHTAKWAKSKVKQGLKKGDDMVRDAGQKWNESKLAKFLTTGSPLKKNGKQSKDDRLNKAMPLVKGEMEGTYIPEGKRSKQELIDDLQDRIGFMNEDVNNGTKTRAEANKVIKELRKRIGYLKQNVKTK